MIIRKSLLPSLFLREELPLFSKEGSGEILRNSVNSSKKLFYVTADNRGMTLIELIIVVSVIGILVVALGFQYQGWQGRYKVESQVREVYADLTDARIKAMQQNVPYGIFFSGSTYNVLRATDASGTIFAAAPGWPAAKRLPPPYQIAWNSIMIINARGLITPENRFALRVTGWSTANPPDYTCIVLSQTKINLGWTTPQNDPSGECLEK